MADNKSSEGKYLIWGCMECGHNHYIHKDNYRQDGLRCEICKGPVKVVGSTNQKPIPLNESPKKISAGTLIITADVSDAIKGLKAVQREAKKATAALKEFEEKQKKISESCPRCGGRILESAILKNIDGTEIEKSTSCQDCGWSN